MYSVIHHFGSGSLNVGVVWLCHMSMLHNMTQHSNHHTLFWILCYIQLRYYQYIHLTNGVYIYLPLFINQYHGMGAV